MGAHPVLNPVCAYGSLLAGLGELNSGSTTCKASILHAVLSLALMVDSLMHLIFLDYGERTGCFQNGNLIKYA